MALNENIQEMGGKIGALEFVRDHVDDSDSLLVPHVILKPGESWTTKHQAQIVELCRREIAELALVRTSSPADWAGMVDVMPTRFSLPENIAQVIEKVRKCCRQKDILKYAANEGGGYASDHITVAVSPFVDSGYRGTVTEHPNFPGGILSDVEYEAEEPSAGKRWYSDAFDFNQNKLISPPVASEVTADIARNALDIRRKVRSTGGLPDDKALQYEFVWDSQNNRPRLVQIREFADIDIIPNVQSLRLRHFGNLEYPVTLPAAAGQFRSVFSDFEKGFPNSPYVLMPKDTTSKLELSDQPLNMQAYVPQQCNFSMTHQNTRFVQDVLRKPDGYAVLDWNPLGGQSPEMSDLIQASPAKGRININNQNETPLEELSLPDPSDLNW